MFGRTIYRLRKFFAVSQNTTHLYLGIPEPPADLQAAIRELFRDCQTRSRRFYFGNVVLVMTPILALLLSILLDIPLLALIGDAPNLILVFSDWGSQAEKYASICRRLKYLLHKLYDEERQQQSTSD